MSDYNEILKNLKEAVSGITEAAKGIANVAGDAAKGFAAEAGDKARSFSRVAKLKLDLVTEEENLKDTYAEIGKAFFDKADKRHPDEEFVRLFDSVMIARSKIAAIEDELKELRSAEGGEDADFESVVAEAEADGDISVEIVVEKSDCCCGEQEEVYNCQAPDEIYGDEDCCCKKPEETECCCEEGEACCCEGGEDCCCEDKPECCEDKPDCCCEE